MLAAVKSEKFIVFIHTFIMGWVVFSLKLTSILKLLDELDFKVYPYIMLTQALTIYLFSKIIIQLSLKNEKIFHFFTLFWSTIIFMLGMWPLFDQYFILNFGMIYPFMIFLLSVSAIQAVEISMRNISTKSLSILQNPHLSSKLALSFELGAITGPIFIIIIKNILPSLYQYVLTFPLLIGFVSLVLVLKLEQKDVKSIGKNLQPQKIFSYEKFKEFLNKKYKFIPYLFLLLGLVAVIKNVQGFAVIIGIKELKKITNTDFVAIFSYFSIAQTIVIILILFLSFFQGRFSSSWPSSFKKFFGVQFFSLLSISFVSSPFFLVLSGALRKILHRAILNKSITMLISSIPENVRIAIQSIAQQFSQTAGFVAISMLSYLSINGIISFKLVWIMSCFLIIFGFLFIKILLKELNNFQIETVTKFHKEKISIYDAVNSCYALANKDASEHHVGLSLLLWWRPRSILTKAIIFSLGRMKNKKNIDTLLKSFDQFERVDIKVSTIYALNQYNSNKVHIFFETTSRDVIDSYIFESNDNYYELCKSMCCVSSLYFKDHLIDLYQKHKSDEVILIRIVRLIKLTIHWNKNPVSKKILKEIFCSKSCIIKLEICHSLYLIRKFKKIVIHFIDEIILEDKKEYEEQLIFLIGKLKLTKFEYFLEQVARKSNFKNIEVLFQLLQLGNYKYCDQTIDCFFSFDYDKQIDFLNVLNFTKPSANRYPLYYALLKKYPEKIEYFLLLLEETQKNFDIDRQVIFTEAQKQKIEIPKDFKLFVDVERKVVT